MKDERDDQTLDLLPTGKRRGRPPTGKALSPAAKQAAYRARQREKTVTVTLNRPDCGELEIFLLNLRDGRTSTLAPEVIDLATSWRMRALTRATSSIEVSVGSQSSSRIARR